jgi:hypothetical protein
MAIDVVAKVTVRVEVKIGGWEEDETIEEITRKASDQALQRVQRTIELAGPMYGVKAVGTSVEVMAMRKARST